MIIKKLHEITTSLRKTGEHTFEVGEQKKKVRVYYWMIDSPETLLWMKP